MRVRDVLHVEASRGIRHHNVFRDLDTIAGGFGISLRVSVPDMVAALYLYRVSPVHNSHAHVMDFENILNACTFGTS